MASSLGTVRTVSTGSMLSSCRNTRLASPVAGTVRRPGTPNTAWNGAAATLAPCSPMLRSISAASGSAAAESCAVRPAATFLRTVRPSYAAVGAGGGDGIDSDIGLASGSKSTVTVSMVGASALAFGRVVDSCTATFSHVSPVRCTMSARRVSSSSGGAVLEPVARRAS